MKLHAEARDRAFEFVKQQIEQKELDAAFVHLRRCKQHLGNISEDDVASMLHRLLSPDAALSDATVIDNEFQKSVIQSVLKIGNFFELMESAVRRGSVQESMVRDYYREMLHVYAETAAPFIKVFRNEPPRPDSPIGQLRRPRTLIGIDLLVKRWPSPAEYGVGTPANAGSAAPATRSRE